MINIIRADIYRIVRGKALYISLAALLLLNFIAVFSVHSFQTGNMDMDSAFHIGIQFGDPEEALAAAEAEMQAIQVNGTHIVSQLTRSMENLIYFLIPVIVVVAGAIFTHNTVKNDIAWGTSRTKLYLSKLILALVISLVFLLFYMGTGMLIATILGGAGGPAPAGHWAHLLAVLGAQFVMITALICFGVFLAFTTKRTAAVIGIFIAFMLVPLMIISLVELANPNVTRLLVFEMNYNIIRLSNLRMLETREILQSLGLGAFYILATTIGGIALFNRAEIK